ncbi:MAG: hypothetical protein ACRDQW_09885, partial [Haloechinothrix sp.]
MSAVAERGISARIKGLTNPYIGGACARMYAYGHTFRWVQDDRYIAVMRGTCTDARRVYVINDHLAGHMVLETPQPVLDAIPAPSTEWWDERLLRRLADDWATS